MLLTETVCTSDTDIHNLKITQISVLPNIFYTTLNSIPQLQDYFHVAHIILCVHISVTPFCLMSKAIMNVI